MARRKADARLEDPLVLAEIELYAELVIAASASDRPLSQPEIDRLLGIAGHRAGGGVRGRPDPHS